MTARTPDRWVPPTDPDPLTILDEAHDDADAGRHEGALAKYLWFHRNAAKHDSAVSFLRLKSALSGWYRLTKAYPPALTKLREIRDATAEAVAERVDLRQSFRDLQAINDILGEWSRTADAFVALDAIDSEAAEAVFFLAKRPLVETGRFRLAGKHLRSAAFDLEIEIFRMDVAEGSRRGPELHAFTEKSFTNEAATFVALLVVSDRHAEAAEIAAKAKAEWDDPGFHAAIDDALRGNVPAPWPARRPKTGES